MFLSFYLVGNIREKDAFLSFDRYILLLLLLNNVWVDCKWENINHDPAASHFSLYIFWWYEATLLAKTPLPEKRSDLGIFMFSHGSIKLHSLDCKLFPSCFPFKNSHFWMQGFCFYAALSQRHFLSSFGDSKWINVWLPRRPSTVPSLQSLSRRLMSPSPQHSHTHTHTQPSFLMETDTSIVIGFRDKLFTLPMLSAAVSCLRGRPFYKWPPFFRPHPFNWSVAKTIHVRLHSKSSPHNALTATVCDVGCWQPVLWGIRCLKIYCLVTEMAVHWLQRRHINRAPA